MAVFRNEYSETLKEMEDKVRNSFASIREEMEDHLDAINENTNEIQSNYETVCDLDNKINKLSEKIDQMSLMIKQLASQTTMAKSRYFLTYDEQKVFIVLYTFGEEKGPLSALDIAIRMNSTELLVKTCVKNMMQKNIPIVGKEIEGQQYFKIDSSFKEIQAKENVLNLDESLIREIGK